MIATAVVAVQGQGGGILGLGNLIPTGITLPFNLIPLFNGPITYPLPGLTAATGALPPAGKNVATGLENLAAGVLNFPAPLIDGGNDYFRNYLHNFLLNPPPASVPNLIAALQLAGSGTLNQVTTLEDPITFVGTVVNLISNGLNALASGQDLSVVVGQVLSNIGAAITPFAYKYAYDTISNLAPGGLAIINQLLGVPGLNTIGNTLTNLLYVIPPNAAASLGNSIIAAETPTNQVGANSFYLPATTGKSNGVLGYNLPY